MSRVYAHFVDKHGDTGMRTMSCRSDTRRFLKNPPSGIREVIVKDPPGKVVGKRLLQDGVWVWWLDTAIFRDQDDEDDGEE